MGIVLLRREVDFLCPAHSAVLLVKSTLDIRQFYFSAPLASGHSFYPLKCITHSALTNKYQDIPQNLPYLSKNIKPELSLKGEPI